MKKIVLLASCLLVFSAGVYAQGCSVCSRTTAGLDDKSAKGLNGGIVYLAFLPLVLMGTVGFFWWKNNRINSDS